MNRLLDLFTYIGLGVVVGLIAGVLFGVFAEDVHPVITGMVAGAVTGVAVVFVRRSSGGSI